MDDKQSDSQVSLRYYLETKIQALDTRIEKGMQHVDVLVAGLEANMHNQLRALEARMIERWDAHSSEHHVHSTNHEREHATTQRAIDKAEDSIQRALVTARAEIAQRFESVNEFRQSLSDAAARFATKELVDEKVSNVMSSTTNRIDANARRIDTHDSVLAELRGRDKGVGLAWGVAVALGGLGLAILGFLATR